MDTHLPVSHRSNNNSANSKNYCVLHANHAASQHVLHLHPNNVGHRRSASNKTPKVFSSATGRKHQTPPAPPTNGVITLQASEARDASRIQYTRAPMQVLFGAKRSTESGPLHDLIKSGKVCASCSHAREERTVSDAGEKSAADAGIYDEPSLRAKMDRGKPVSEMIISDGYISLRTAAEKSDRYKRESFPKYSAVAEKPGVFLEKPGAVAEKPVVFSEKPGAVAEKPIVSDVRLAPRHQVYETRSKLRGSKSTNAIDRVALLLDTDDEGSSLTSRLASLRSSFVDPNGPPTRCSVYIELGEYQTLLKHSRRDSERVYSLPQPQCYGEDTLRAVRLITDKYDTFQRQQMRAMSFRSSVSPLATAAAAGGKSNDGGMAASNRKMIREDDGGANLCSGPTSGGSVAVENAEESVAVKESSAANSNVADVTLSSSAEAHRVALATLPIDAKQLEIVLLRDYFTTPDDGAAASRITATAGVDGGISRLDRLRTEMFYRSRHARVFVCAASCNLYARACAPEDSALERPWIRLHTGGVPVWLLNEGSALRRRELILIVADRATGFPLWQDKINYMSDYRELDEPGVHAMAVSGSLSKMVKLEMADEAAAGEFLAKYRSVTGDPDDDLWMMSEDCDRKKYAEQQRWKRRKSECGTRGGRRKEKLEKASISQPCNFVHVTRVDPEDECFRTEFAEYLIAPGADRLKAGQDGPETQALKDYDDENACDATEYRPRLPTS